MPSPARTIDALPAAAAAALRQLGADLATARKRRGESRRQWALRLEVSIPTLTRLEAGDPRVAVGVWATALWMIGQVDRLKTLADPKEDAAALANEITNLKQRRARRSTAKP